jgi:hypothetical protein
MARNIPVVWLAIPSEYKRLSVGGAAHLATGYGALAGKLSRWVRHHGAAFAGLAEILIVFIGHQDSICKEAIVLF